MAYTFATPEDAENIDNIEKLTKAAIERWTGEAGAASEPSEAPSGDARAEDGDETTTRPRRSRNRSAGARARDARPEAPERVEPTDEHERHGHAAPTVFTPADDEPRPSRSRRGGRNRRRGGGATDTSGPPSGQSSQSDRPRRETPARSDDRPPPGRRRRNRPRRAHAGAGAGAGRLGRMERPGPRLPVRHAGLTAHMVAGVSIGVKSPCINVCTLDTDTGWCLGCARTAAEIAEWPTGKPEQLAAIRRALPERMERLAAAGKV